MTNYNNGKIYKLECLTTGLIYIGSTTKQYLSQRLSHHLYGYKKYQNNNHHFVSSFQILENDNYRIELLESVNCNTKDELLAREGYYIKTLDCVNKNITGRSKKEYYQDNREQILEKRNDNKEKLNEYNKKYRQDNKEQIQKYKKEKHTCECGGKYTTTSKSLHCKTIIHQTFLNNQI